MAILYEIVKLSAMCHVSQYTFEDIGHPSELVCEILIQILIASVRGIELGVTSRPGSYVWKVLVIFQVRSQILKSKSK